MKIKFTITAILILLLFSSCDKKQTDPPEEINYKSAHIYATVTDAIGNAIENAVVEAKYRYPGSDTIWVWLGTFTNVNGNCELYIEVNKDSGKDSIIVYAKDIYIGISSDTIRKQVEHDGQVFNMTFILK